MCDLLPSSLKQDCDTLVEQYGPVIITLLVNELKPDAVCGVLGLCSNQTGLLNQINNLFQFLFSLSLFLYNLLNLSEA